MNTKKAFIGLTATIVMGGAVAKPISPDILNDKRAQAQMLTSLMKDIKPIMVHPECTIREL